MPRKIVQGAIRDKERTRLRLVNAVGRILKSKGFQGLQVTRIAAAAGVDKKLVYEYFGSVDNLVNEYLRTRDYWTHAAGPEPPADFSDGGREASKLMIAGQFDFLRKNRELQKILLWELTESRGILRKLAAQREEAGEALLRGVADPHFGENSGVFRAVLALLVAGGYYLNLHTDVNGSTFCGLDLKDDADRALVRRAIADIIDRAYDGYADGTA